MITFKTFLTFFFEVELIFEVTCYYLVRFSNIIFYLMVDNRTDQKRRKIEVDKIYFKSDIVGQIAVQMFSKLPIYIQKCYKHVLRACLLDT